MRRHHGILERASARIGLFACLAALPLGGMAAAGAPIYSCIDASGKKLTSDRPIPECANKDQRLLNADGSVKKVVPPTPTVDERADAEVAERRAAAERAAQQDAVRRDRNLMMRFPNEATHRRAREAALDDVRKSIRNSEERLKLLAVERKPLIDESEFYVDRQLPAKLKQALDANDAAVDAQRTLMANQQAELVRINALYDAELERLRRLWSGVQPGSLGALASAQAASAPRKAASQ